MLNQMCYMLIYCVSDPWWLFTTCSLFYVIKKQYDFSLFELIKVSPRFGIMLLSMCLSLAFTVIDILSVTGVFSSALPTGVEPFWKVFYLPYTSHIFQYGY